MRGHLLRAGGTYLANAAGMVGGAAAAASKIGDIKIMFPLPIIAGTVASLGLKSSLAKKFKGTPKLSREDVENLKKGMGVGAKIYEAKKYPDLPKAYNELNAAYVQPIKNKFLASLYEQQIENAAKTKNKEELKKLIREGGLVLPRAQD